MRVLRLGKVNLPKIILRIWLLFFKKENNNQTYILNVYKENLNIPLSLTKFQAVFFLSLGPKFPFIKSIYFSKHFTVNDFFVP